MAPSPVEEIIQIRPGSDGDAAKWPGAGLRHEAPDVYMKRLASRWMQDRGEAISGRKYILNKLPEGYALFGKARNKDPNHIDRYLYGHPVYKFRSVEEFYDHFKCLMDYGSAASCRCIGCMGGRKQNATRGPRPTRGNVSMRQGASSSARAQPIVIPQSQESPLRQIHKWTVPARDPTPEHEMIDEEGNPDIFRRLADRLKETIVMEEPIRQYKSFDWIIDRTSIGPLLESVASNPSFVPRLGEVVLFVRGLQDHQSIFFNKAKQTFMMWDSQMEATVALAQWEAGVVTETPHEPIDSADLIHEKPKSYQINYSGFRIEPMATVGSIEKHWSKRIAHVRMHAIRPFVLYREILRAIKPKDYHATVQAALTVMSSISLFSPFHFKGLWPEATVFCRGIFIGSELIVVGDTIRLLPARDQESSQVWDVVKVTSIKMKMLHLDARENPEYEDPTSDSTDSDRHYDCCIHVDGIAFTRDQSRAWGMGKIPLSSEIDHLPEPCKDSGDWYHLHDPARRWKVPFSRVLGRHYERVAIKSWFAELGNVTETQRSHGFAPINASQSIADMTISDTQEEAGVSKGLRGVMSARTFSTQRDPRMQETGGKAWFWANHRVEQLDLHEVKGQVVSPYIHGKPTRDTTAWRRAMNIRERGAGHRPKTVGHAPTHRRGRPPKAGTSMLAASAVGSALAEVQATSGSQDEADASSEDMTNEMTDDVTMEDAPNVVEQERAYIDPSQIMIISDDSSSELPSENETL